MLFTIVLTKFNHMRDTTRSKSFDSIVWGNLEFSRVSTGQITIADLVKNIPADATEFDFALLSIFGYAEELFREWVRRLATESLTKWRISKQTQKELAIAAYRSCWSPFRFGGNVEIALVIWEDVWGKEWHFIREAMLACIAKGEARTP